LRLKSIKKRTEIHQIFNLFENRSLCIKILYRGRGSLTVVLCYTFKFQLYFISKPLEEVFKGLHFEDGVIT
jgi:hypothetical protein